MENGDTRLDLNRATSEELLTLNGVGPALARQIVELREDSGPFESVDDLIAVKGIGPSLVDRIRPMVAIGAEDIVEVSVPLDETEMLAEDQSETIMEEEPELEAEEPEPVVVEELEPEQEPEFEPESEPEPEPELEPEIEAEPVVVEVGEEDVEPAVEDEYLLPPPLEIVEPARGRLTFWKGLLLVVLGGFVGGLLSLGAIWLVNGTLDLNPQARLFDLQAQIMQMRSDNSSLERQIGDFGEELGALRSDLAVLPQMRADIDQADAAVGGLGDQISGLQKDVAGMGEEITQVNGRVDELDAQINARIDELSAAFDGMAKQVAEIQAQMDTIAEKAERFDAFLAGLLSLLQETAPQSTE